MKLVIFNNYHDALITRIQIGPNKEICFSSIQNFSEVAKFFHEIEETTGKHVYSIEELEVNVSNIHLKTDHFNAIITENCKIKEGVFTHDFEN